MSKTKSWTLFLLQCWTLLAWIRTSTANNPPVFLRDMNGMRLLENTEPGSVIYQLQGFDAESDVTYGMTGGESHFSVHPKTGVVTLTAKIEYQKTPAFRFYVTLQDKAFNGPSNTISKMIRVYVVPSLSVPSNFQQIATAPQAVPLDPLGDNPVMETDSSDVVLPTPTGNVVIESFDEPQAKETSTIPLRGSAIVSLVTHPISVVTESDIKDDTSSPSEQRHVSTVKPNENTDAETIGLTESILETETSTSPTQISSDGSTSDTAVILESNTDHMEPSAYLSDIKDSENDNTFQTGTEHTTKSNNFETTEISSVESTMDEALTTVSDKETEFPDKESVEMSSLSSSSSTTSSTLLITTRTTRTTTIADPSAPRFFPSVAQVSVTENWPTTLPLPFKKQIYVVTPPSIDSMILQLFVVSNNSKVTSGIKTEPSFLSENGHFDIVVTDPKLLDLESNGAMTLEFSIEARDLSTGLYAKLPVSVELIDVNDHRPQFEANGYTFHAAETLAQDAVVGSISAYDMDYGTYGTDSITFSLFGKYAKFFELSETRRGTIEILANPCASKSGNVCNGFEKKLPDMFSLTLRATDGGGSGKYSDVSVRVEMDREDTHSPHFDKEYYHAWILEQTALFDPLLQIQTVDPDNSEVRYFLEDSTALFDIDNRTGILFVRHPKYVTVENLGQRFNLTAYATDGKNELTKVNITLEVIEQRQTRNKAPFFVHESYDFSLSCTESVVGTVEAVDTESSVKYRLLEGGAGYFHINETSGEIIYSGPNVKDTETYFLHIMAVDMETPPKLGFVNATVTVTGMGSSLPHIRDPSVVRKQISKESEAGTVIWTYSATDEDSDASLQYSIEEAEAFDKDGLPLLSMNWTEHFSLGNDGVENGSVILDKSLLNVDVLVIHFTIIIRDRSHPQEPEQRTYLILSVEPFDATDSTSAREKIETILLPEKVWIPENLDPGSYVYTAVGYPIKRKRDGVIAYALTLGYDYFSIDRKTGIISVAKSLDNVGEVNVTVRAFHLISGSKASASSAIVITAVNNHSPFFDEISYESQVSEGAPNGTEVLQALATDGDGGMLSYTLTGLHSAYFTVDSNGTILTSGDLDFEKMDLLQFFLEATDQGQRMAKVPISVRISDINDNHPVFETEAYSAGIMENSPIGSHLLQVYARDADYGDNGAVQYTLINVPSPLINILSIDPFDGTIRNVQPLTNLDGNYQFGAVAWDGKRQNASVPIFLSIQSTSRCYPRFTSPLTNDSIVRIPENQDPGLLVTTFKATTEGLNCQLFYVIWQQTAEQYIDSTEEFILDRDSGDLRTKVSFDRENRSRFSLVIAAHSGILYTQTLIEIQIVDIDDNVPEFGSRRLTYEIPEDASVGTVICQVSALDPDIGENGRVRYHLISDDDSEDLWPSSAMFHLSTTEGTLSTKTALDREKKDTYNMWIIATNSESMHTVPENLEDRTDAVSVKIGVTDVNDNGPVFEKPIHKVAAAADTPVGRLLTTVHAQDPDVEDMIGVERKTVLYRAGRSVYLYKNLSREAPGFVKVDSLSGEIRVAQLLDTYSQGMFSVLVESADSRNSSLAKKDTTVVKIWVYDPEQVVRIVVNVAPDRISMEASSRILETIGKKIDAELLLQGVEYHEDEYGRISSDTVDLLAVAVSRGSQEIMDTREVLYRVDMLGSEITGNSHLGVTRILPASAVREKVHSTKMSSPASIGLLVFAFTLCFGLLGFLLLLCYYRYSFVSEKQQLEIEANRSDRKVKTVQGAPGAFTSSVSSITQNPLWTEHQGEDEARSFDDPSVVKPVFHSAGSGSPPPAYFPRFTGSSSELKIDVGKEEDSGPIVIYPDEYGNVGAYYSAESSPTFERYLEDNDTYEAMEREI